MRTLILSVCICALASLAPRQPATLHNPIIPGFYPDPSICRVGNDYYTAHSSFEFFPGVPVFHSRDLVHWHQIGYCLTRASQLPLDKVRASGGIYAPTLRYHNSTFYVVTTNVDGGGNFYVSAKDPAGAWSEPVWLDREGIDPSLFFDEDGAVYYTRHQGMGDGYIAQTKIDLDTGRLEGPLREIWRGTGGIWPEGPHLYKVNGKYFLMIAEGGTSYEHMVTIARGDSPWGPFTRDPNNPILSHRTFPDSPFQALGHADMTETPDGWWMVCLGIRPQGGKYHHLGRETFLAPITWTQEGWPSVGANGTLASTMRAPQLPQYLWKDEPARDNFDGNHLGFAWNFLRNPHQAAFSLAERPGFLRLKGSAITMNDQDSPAFVGRRQTQFICNASTRLEFNPKGDNEEAGLVVRGNENNHYEIGITRRQGVRRVFFRKVLDGKTVSFIDQEVVGIGAVILSVQASSSFYEFFYEAATGLSKSMGKALTIDLSSERIGGFTGVYIGMYATGNGQKNKNPADFDWFEYSSKGIQ